MECSTIIIVILLLVIVLLTMRMKRIEGFQQSLNTSPQLVSGLPSQPFMHSPPSISGYIAYGNFLKAHANESINLALRSTYEQLVKASMEGKLTPSLITSVM